MATDSRRGNSRRLDTEEEYAIARANSRLDLPGLQGTDKQIAWAATIRAKVVVILDFEAIDNWAEGSTGYDSITSRPHAKDWIECLRGNPAAIAQSMIAAWQNQSGDSVS
jgi:hypothetical protein